MILNSTSRHGFQVFLSDKEAIGLLRNELNVLQQYLNNKSRCFSKESYKRSATHLIEFMYWYKERGYYDCNVYAGLHEGTIVDIGGAVRKVVSELGIKSILVHINQRSIIIKQSEIGCLCNEYLEAVKERYSITKLMNEVVSSLFNMLRRSGFDVRVCKSNSSKSIYIAVDGYYHMRISDHEKLDYNGSKNIVCCKSKPDSSDSCMYVTMETSKKCVRSVYVDIKDKKRKYIKNHSKRGYSKYIANAIKNLSGYTVYKDGKII